MKYATMMQGTVAQWLDGSRFQEVRILMEDDVYTTIIDNTLIAVVSILLDEDRQMMVRKMEGVSGIPKTMIHSF